MQFFAQLYILLLILFYSRKTSKKYELKINEKYEKYKADIENKTYISKTKFDAEFNLYRSLSKTFLI